MDAPTLLNSQPQYLPLESEIEEEANSRSGLLKNFRVAKCEYSRFALLGIMFGIIGFIYSFMRILKDNYVMSRQDPNCISCLKIFYVMPLSFIIVILINYLLTKRTISKVFSMFCMIFMSLFFMLGIVAIFEDYIMFDTNIIETKLATFSYELRGLGFLKYILLTINQPLATTVYIVAELWGSLILSYLFLSYLNEICTEGQNGRFIPPLFIIANVSLFLSALVTTLFFNITKKLSYSQNTLFMGAIFFLEGFLALGVLFCKYILENYIVTKPIFIPSKTKTTKKAKPSTSFKESLKTMMKSKFLLAMCAIVCFYGMAYNILETVYKNGVKVGADFKNIERGRYSGKFNNIDQYATSIAVIALNLSPFSNLVDSSGWLLVALITPLVFTVSTVCILGLSSYNSAAEDASFSFMNKIFGGSTSFYVFENYSGIFCLAAMKIFKYTAFDVTKERISMKISGNHRPKFKSIYDGIFNKFGKSAGSFFCMLLSSVSKDVDIRGLSPISTVFVAIMILAWVKASSYLSRSYNKCIDLAEPIDLDLVESEETEGENENEAKKLQDTNPNKIHIVEK